MTLQEYIENRIELLRKSYFTEDASANEVECLLEDINNRKWAVTYTKGPCTINITTTLSQIEEIH